MTEAEVIACLTAACAASGPQPLLGIGDDAAVLAPSTNPWVLAQDTLNEGVHFPADIAPADLAWRALAVNVSDIAAMGAVPRWFTLSLSLPSADADWVRTFASGLAEAAAAFGVQLIGGDTVRGACSLSLAVTGELTGPILQRRQASVGDRLFVSGSLGDAAAGLALWQEQLSVAEPHRGALLQRFLRPQPCLGLGVAAANIVSAGMDISDGLLSDLPRLLRANQDAVLWQEALPCSGALAAACSPAQRLAWQLAGGDDYELLLAVPRERTEALQQAANDYGVVVSEIGEIVTGGGGVRLFDGGRPVSLPEQGFAHF